MLFDIEPIPIHRLLRKREICNTLTEKSYKRSSLCWNSCHVRQLKVSNTLRGHEGCVNRLCFNENGSMLASGSDDCTVRIWDAQKQWQTIQVLHTGHMSNIFAVLWIQQEKYIASAGMDELIIVTEIENQNRDVYMCNKGRVKQLCTKPSSGGAIFASASEDGTLRQFDRRQQHTCVSGEECVQTLMGKSQTLSFKSIDYHPNEDHYIICASDDPVVRVFDVRRMKREIEMDDECAFKYKIPCITKNATCTCVEFDRSGKRALASFNGGAVYALPFPAVNEPECCARYLHHIKSEEPIVDSIAKRYKEDGNIAFKHGAPWSAIDNYSTAISYLDRSHTASAVLHGNRAAALMQRKISGDIEEAIADCESAIAIDPSYVKAYYRKVSALIQLKRALEAQEFFNSIPDAVKLHPSMVQSQKQIEESLNSQTGNATAGKKRRFNNDLEMHGNNSNCKLNHVPYRYQRYVGALSWQTDIKETSMLGDDIVVSASDDGQLYFFNAVDGNLIQTLSLTDEVLNCVRCHPTLPLIASSGIDNEIFIVEPIGDVAESNNTDVHANNMRSLQRNRSRMAGLFDADERLLNWLLQANFAV